MTPPFRWDKARLTQMHRKSDLTIHNTQLPSSWGEEKFRLVRNGQIHSKGRLHCHGDVFCLEEGLVLPQEGQRNSYANMTEKMQKMLSSNQKCEWIPISSQEKLSRSQLQDPNKVRRSALQNRIC